MSYLTALSLPLALLSLLFVSACASTERAPEPEPPDLVGSWTVEEVLGTEVAGEGVYLAFASDGSLSGSTGVNTLNGSWEVSEGTLSIPPLATTRMAGPPELMDQESRFTEALGRARGWVVEDDGRLSLRDDAGETLLRAAPRP
ncbi:MAG: META domain-containing protein [Planctomycetota bacterium]